MLTANYSLCGGNSEMPTLQLESAPVGISNYTLQWYYRTGNQTCPEGSITGGWISIAGATSTTLTPDQFVGTRTFACYVNVAQGEVLDSGWMQNCALVSVASSTSQTIIGNPNVVPFNTYTYAVSTVVGNTYTWDVQNGAVISGQGTSVVQIMWGQNGPYQITLTESNGTCSNTSVLFVVNNSCSNTVSLASSMPQGFCEGAGAVLTANTSAAGVVFSWYKNGTLMANENGSSLMITEGGDYQVMITSGSCTSVSQILSVTQFTAPVVPDLSVSNQSPGCSGGSAEVWIEGLSFDSYLWSNGATSASIEVVASGDYSVVVTDQNGCSASSSVVTVNLSLTETLPICLVTVDQQTGNNQVIWEPLTSDVIDAYAVYKETNAADVYALIGTVAYGQDGIFTDVNSNSAVQASRYKLAIIDTCNVESSRSPLHKTIHLTSNVGLNNTVNLIWSAYEGFSFASYNIYRGTDINNMTLLTTIASNLTSYTDVSPIGGNAFYVIEVEGISCDPTRSAVSSRSNMIQHTASGVEEQASQMLRVYPNPATDQITIQCASSLIGQEYVIYNVVGEVVMRGIIGSSATTIDVGDLSSGTYAFKASNAKKLFVKK
jgi:hypothetical protein